MQEVYFFSAGHKEFPLNRDLILEAKRHDMRRSPLMVMGIITAPIVLIFVVLIARGQLETARGFPLLVVITLTSGTIAAFAAMLSIRSTINLYENGQVLYGEVVSTKPTSDHPEIYDVKYKFMSPLGKSLSGTQKANSTYVAIPDAGTPVKVLYKSDRHFMVL